MWSFYARGKICRKVISFIRLKDTCKKNCFMLAFLTAWKKCKTPHARPRFPLPILPFSKFSKATSFIKGNILHRKKFQKGFFLHPLVPQRYAQRETTTSLPCLQQCFRNDKLLDFPIEQLQYFAIDLQETSRQQHLCNRFPQYLNWKSKIYNSIWLYWNMVTVNGVSNLPRFFKNENYFFLHFKCQHLFWIEIFLSFSVFSKNLI